MTTKERLDHISRAGLDSVKSLALTCKTDASAARLTILEAGKDIDFQIRRSFWVANVPSGQTRGNHAHRWCTQLLVATSGVVDVDLFDGAQRRCVRLEAADQALLVPPMIWASQTYLSKDAVLMVFCDHLYDEADYIRNSDEFLELIRSVTNSAERR